MGPRERREREKEVLRQEILDAARELFVKEGYENVSMRRIAEKIEYSPTTIYLYFQDKAELLYHLCEETFAKLVKTFESFEDNSDPLNCLRRGCRAYIDFGLKYPNHYRVTFMLPREGGEKRERFLQEKSMGRQAFNHLRSIVEECVRQNKFRRVDVEVTSQAFWAAIHGVTSLLITKPKFPWAEKNKLINFIIDTMIDGLKA